MKKQEQWDRFFEYIREIREDIVIVEGKRDAKGLNTLGLKNILVIRGRPLLRVVTEAERLREFHRNSDIIILTDFDREGKRLAAELAVLLRAHRLHPNRAKRRKFLDSGFTKIEELNSITRLLDLADLDRPLLKIREGDDYGEIGANINKIRNKGTDKGKRSRRKA